MPAANKTGNEYADLLGPSLDETPKAVLAAVAVSFAHLLDLDQGSSPNASRVRRAIRKEWKILHENGIVPQRPPK